MSISTFFTSVENGAEKVLVFVVKQMTAAETLLGAGTGSVKANIVITAVEKALEAMGVPLGTVEAELKAVVDALTALLNKAGMFPKPPATPPVP